MWLDLVAATLLLVFAAVGAWRGAFRTGTALAALLVGYGCALLLAPVLAEPLAAATGLPELLALPAGGTLGFVGGYLAVGGTAAVIRRVGDVESDDPSPRDRFLGATFGLVRGALVVLLLSWGALWLDALRATGGESPLPPVADSSAAAVTGKVVEAGIGATLGSENPAGRVMARLAAQPARAIGEFADVLESPSFSGLREDELFWTYVEHGSVDAALNRGSFLTITHDAALRGRIVGLGLMPTAAAEDPGVFREEAAAMLEEVGPRIRGLKNDPELQALAEDPEVIAMAQSGDTLGLLRHPGFRQLVDRLTSAPSPDPAAAPAL